MLRKETLKRLREYNITEDALIEALREIFPNGHPDFLLQTIGEMELHSLKNHDYAKGGHVLGNFNRVSTILSMYPGLKLSDPRVFALVLAMKQVDAVLWGLSENIEHKVEGLNSRLDDISVYAKIVKCMNNDLAKLHADIDRQFGVDLHGKEEVPAYENRQACDKVRSRVAVDSNGPREMSLDDLRGSQRATCPEIAETRNASAARGTGGDDIRRTGVKGRY